jgi:hypothetical protein
MIYTGEITEAIYLSVEDEPKINFIYGTIVYDLSARFSEGDWIATSHLIKFKEVDGGFAAITQNSIYRIGSFDTMVIKWEAVDNIRLGTPPEIAVKLLNGEWPPKWEVNRDLLMDDKSKFTVTSSVAKILDRWQLSVPQKIAILGFESEADLGRFVDSPPTLNWSPSLEQRLSLIINIHTNLRVLFSNPENIYGFMTMVNNNSPFLGKRPIVMASQNLDGLNTVYQAVSSIGNND